MVLAVGSFWVATEVVLVRRGEPRKCPKRRCVDTFLHQKLRGYVPATLCRHRDLCPMSIAGTRTCASANLPVWGLAPHIIRMLLGCRYDMVLLGASDPGGGSCSVLVLVCRR